MKSHDLRKNFDIFTVDEASSRCEEDLKSGSLSKTSKKGLQIESEKKRKCNITKLTQEEDQEEAIKW